ncbi:MAG: glycosyltransferase family 4 protein, partial [Ilumatobacteraceae bacterium]
SYASFTAMCVIGLVRSKRADHVFVESPPLFLAVPGRLVAWLWRATAIFNVADLWPDAAVDLGLLGPGLPLRVLQAIERWAYRSYDVVNSVTDSVRRVLTDGKGIPERKLLDLPNGVDTELFRPIAPERRAVHDLANTVVYAGTVGYIHAPEHLVSAFALLAERGRDVRLGFYATGSELDRLRAHADRLGLATVSFADPVPLPELAEILPGALAGVVTLADNDMARKTRPSKMFPTMASGRPVLYCGDGEGADMVQREDAGVVCPNAPEAIADAIEQLIDGGRADELGANGRAFVERDLSWNAIVDRWLVALEQVR